ncbi:MAG: hypothetical protein ACYCWW_12470 [Deltaproteobacteria bacterium]
MNRTIARLLFCALSSGLAACTVAAGPPAPTTGSVSFVWTFNGGQPCELAGVYRVGVKVAGSAIIVPCRDQGGISGTTVPAVAAGPVSFTLTGEDSGGNPLYAATGSVTAVGGADTTVQVDLTPTVPLAASNITLLWSFAGASCAQAGIANVTYTIDNHTTTVPGTFVGANGAGTDGATIQNFAAGSYPFSIRGQDGTGATAYQGAGKAYVNGQSSVTIAIDLAPVQTQATTGSLTVAWTFGGQPCSAAAVDHIHVALFDSGGNPIASTDQTVLCSAFPNGLAYDNLPPGTYWLDIQGIQGNAVTFQTVNYQVVVFAGSNATATIDAQPLQ